MSDRAAWRELVAATIADGGEVDWSRAEAPADDPNVDDFRDLERIARAFSSSARGTARPVASPSAVLFRWGSLEVLARVGEGAFGEVFRAYDPVLERDVALKLRRSGPSGEEQGGRRYLEEARRLARVRHPHVLAVYGAAVHDGRVGLWTELVEGRSLEEQMRETRSWEPAEVVRIGLDLAAALAAIHAAGLAHGDVKAANVLLDPTGRVVLADLSAARELGGPGGAREGTPLAMAPELLAGGAPSPASDIYALGALLFRLSAGRHPVEATTLEELRVQLEGKPQESLKTLRPELPRDFVAAVDRSLSRSPGERFSSAEAMATALAAALGGEGSAAWRARQARRRTVLLAAVGALGVCTALVVGRIGVSEGRFVEGLPANPSIVLLGFAPLDGVRDEGLGSVLAELVGADLGAGPGLRVLSPELVARLPRESLRAAARSLEAGTLAGIGRQTAAQLVASGSFAEIDRGEASPKGGRMLRVALRLQRVDRPDLELEVQREAAEADLPALAADLAQQLRHALGAPPTVGLTSRYFPVDPEAARLYAAGLERLRNHQAKSAVEPLARATERSPEAAGPWFALAQAREALGDRVGAIEPARTAFQLAAGLPELERRRIEVLYYRASQEWDLALAAVRAAVELSPGDPELELSRIDLEVAAGRLADALHRLDELQAPGSTGASDPRFALARCRVLGQTGEWSKLIDAARSARRLARARDSRIDEAAALRHEAIAVAFHGRPREAVPLATEAVRLATESGDPASRIDALHARAAVAGELHDGEGANASWREALAVARSLGDRRREQAIVYGLATATHASGNLAEKVELGRESLSLCHQLRLERCIAETSTLLGGALLYAGPLSEAHELLADSLEAHRRAGRRGREGECLSFLAEWAQKRDDLVAAERYSREWLALMRADSDARFADWGVANITWEQLDGGADIDPAGPLAAIAERARAGGDTDLEGIVRAMRSLAALRRGRLDLAESESRRAVELVPPPSAPYLSYFNWWIRGEVLLARGGTADLAELDRQVPRLLDFTRRNGVLSEELEGRLLAARLDAAHGRLERARDALADLASEARAKGYLRTARRATEAMSRLGG